MSLTKRDLKLIEELLDRKLEEKLEQKLEEKLSAAFEKNNNILIALIDDKISNAVNELKIEMSGNFATKISITNHELRLQKIERKIF